MNAVPPAEFCRPVASPRIEGESAMHEIAATEAERAALARRFGLVALEALSAAVRLERMPGGLLRLAARLAAVPVQECVVTLEPVVGRIAEEFVVLYGPGAAARAVTLDGADETVEPLAGAILDIGEAVAQQLSLALDPAPRRPEADAALAGLAAEPVRESPFAALENRRQVPKEKD